ncbi:MAG: RNA pseudouridine synthase, partial [Bacteroidales bacterium]|nr:RNA pseudouridine synthase [Bacteroidales bacterium]
AVTHWHVLERFGTETLLDVRLETGRTHQIRVHFMSQNHPLFNDEIYGGSRILRGTTFSKYKRFIENCFEIMPRHALHAKTLEFIHPRTGKLMSFDSEIAPDMQEVINKWRIYAQAGKTFLEDEE